MKETQGEAVARTAGRAALTGWVALFALTGCGGSHEVEQWTPEALGALDPQSFEGPSPITIADDSGGGGPNPVEEDRPVEDAFTEDPLDEDSQDEDEGDPDEQLAAALEGSQGSAVASLGEDRSLIVGGLPTPSVAGVATSLEATRRVSILDRHTGQLSDVAPLNRARAFPTVEQLEDGRVLVSGGVSRVDGDGRRRCVHSAELYDPVRDRWVELDEPLSLGAASPTGC